MKQKAFLALVILGIILISGCIQQGTDNNTKMSAPIDMSFTMIGAPAINQEVTLELSAKRLHPESINADTVPAGLQIELPENFELISGNLSWNGEVPKQDTIHISAKVKAVKTGTYTIKGTAYLVEGKTKKLFVKVTDDVSTSRVSEEPFDSSTSASSQTQAIEEKSK